MSMAWLIALCVSLAGALGDHGAPKRRIFFERDRAGFNNLRLQFESLVALAAVTGRELVLPPPSEMAHVDAEPYYELDLWCASSLSQVVQLGLGVGMPSDVFTPWQQLSSIGPSELPQDRDWLFRENVSRIQHFECLRLSPEEHRVAARAVLHGLHPNPRLFEDALNGLDHLGLQPGNFSAAHIRRGDFSSFRENLMKNGQELAATLNENDPEGRPLLIATNAEAEDHMFSELQRHSTAAAVLRTDAVYHHESSTTRVLVDMLMLAEAAVFTGTPDSTFTLGVMQLRTRRAVLAGRSPPQPMFTAGNTAPAAGTCWNKVSSFGALTRLDCPGYSLASCRSACSLLDRGCAERCAHGCACPASGLEACIRQCPDALFAACTQGCVSRCPDNALV